MTTYESATTGARSAAVDSDSHSRAYRTFTEAKEGFKTSEFYLTLIAIAGVLIATYVDSDSLNVEDGFRYATWIAVAYIVSRGLAKLGTREPYTADND